MSSVVFVGLLGVVVGVLAERIARVFGRLYCETSDWETRYTTATLNPFGLYKEIEPEQAKMFAKRVGYRFAIDVFNGKEIPTGLRDIKVELVREGGSPLESRPYDLMSVRKDELSKGLVRTEVAVINIPPRHFVHMQLTGSFDTREAVVALRGGSWKRVEIVGQLSRGLLLSRSKIYRKKIATP